MLPLFLFLFLLPIGDGQGHEFVNPVTGLRNYRGNYVNPDWGFAVRIPSGMVGIGAADPAPNHGFRLDFSDPLDYILVDASFTSSGDEPFFLPEGFKELETQKTKAKLAGLDATRTVRKLKRESNGFSYIWMELWTKHEYSSLTVYSITLQTPEKYLKERKILFNSLAASFRFMKYGK